MSARILSVFALAMLISSPLVDAFFDDEEERQLSSHTKYCKDVVLDFELSAGTYVSKQYDGVTIFGRSRRDKLARANDAMIFDSKNPTGGDHDLKFANQGGILILSEDRDPSDPDDNARGGKLLFRFQKSIRLDSVKLLDNEEGAEFIMNDAHGHEIEKIWVGGKGASGNNKLETISLGGTENVGQLIVKLKGSSALDDLKYALPCSPNNLLETTLDRYPGYTGDLSVSGLIRVQFNKNGVLKLQLKASGLAPNCVDCGVHIHEGTSCESNDLVLGHYWNAAVVTDQWTTEGGAVYETGSDGKTKSAFSIRTGHGFEANIGHAAVVHDADGTRIACGILTQREILETSLSRYPGYTGDLNVKGSINVRFNGDDSLTLQLKASGLTPNCKDCGVHIHAGTSCESNDLVLGHYWNAAVITDQWTTEGGAVYKANSKGKTKSSFTIVTGHDFEANIGHAAVVHDADGTRIACGVLEVKW